MVAFNVAQLLQATPGETREQDFSEQLPIDPDDARLAQPVSGHVKLTRTSRGILVAGKYRTGLALECARCLDPIEVPIEGPFEEEFIPSLEIRSGGVAQPDPDEPDADQSRIDDHHILDLNDLLRQDILTNLPFQSLCRPDCPGLCPRCGERLDPGHPIHPEEDLVEATPAEAGSPFARLATLLQRDDGDR